MRSAGPGCESQPRQGLTSGDGNGTAATGSPVVLETHYRRCGIRIEVARDGSTLVIDTVVDCWMAPPFVAMQQKVIASGITDDLARELALAIGERWIDAILPFQESS